MVHLELIADVEPTNHHEVVMRKTWELAMKEELAAIERNDTRELIKLSYDKKAIEVKWVF